MVSHMRGGACYILHGLDLIKKGYSASEAAINCGQSIDPQGNLSTCENTFWKMPCQHRICMFVWRFAHDSLAVRANLARGEGSPLMMINACYARVREKMGHICLYPAARLRSYGSSWASRISGVRFSVVQQYRKQWISYG